MKVLIQTASQFDLEMHCSPNPFSEDATVKEVVVHAGREARLAGADDRLYNDPDFTRRELHTGNLDREEFVPFVNFGARNIILGSLAESYGRSWIYITGIHGVVIP
jgi:hypothetical protein